MRSCRHLSWDCVFELVMFRWSIIFASDWFGPLFLFCQNQFYDRGYLSNVWKHRYLVYLANWGRDFSTETLLIQKHNPNLNVDRISIPLYLFNTWVIWIILSPAAASFSCFICLCFVFFAIHYFWQCEK